MAKTKPNQLVQSIDRALDILEKLVQEKDGIGVTELSKRLGLHKSTVYRLLATLNYRGYVEQDKKTSNYKIGLKLFELGSKVLNNLDLRTKTKPYLEEMVELTKETVHLGILDEFEVIYIEKVESPETIRMYSQIGRRVPAYCTSLGKVLLAYSSHEFISKYLQEVELKAYTSNTITNTRELKGHLTTIKNQGFAVDNEEQEVGIRCIAGPIFNYDGEIIASFSISGPVMRITDEKVVQYCKLIKGYSQKMSKALGFLG